MNRDIRFKLLYPIIGGVATILLVLLLNVFDFIEQIENFLLDMKYVFSSRETSEQYIQEGVKQVQRGFESDIMILGIDEESVGLTEVLGKFPWPRSVYGEIISYFSVDDKLLNEYDMLIDDSDNIVRNLRDEKKAIENNWRNEPLKLIDELNHQAIEYFKNNDDTLYQSILNINLNIISRLSKKTENKEILDEVKILHPLILSEIEPSTENKIEYYIKINEFIKELKLYINYSINIIEKEISEQSNEKEKENIRTQKEKFIQELDFTEKLSIIMNVYISSLENPNDATNTIETKNYLLTYIKENLGLDPEISNSNQQEGNEISSPTEIEQKTDVEKIEEYIRIIRKEISKKLSELNKSAIKEYSTLEENKTLSENLNNKNYDVIRVLLKNSKNIEILENSTIANEIILRNLQPESKNIEKEAYYNDILKLCQLLELYITMSNQNISINDTISEFIRKVDLLRYYYQKLYEKDDILEWNREDIEILRRYNGGDIRPKVLFFDIFIDQPGETKIYELSTKRSFYDLIKTDIENSNGFENFNYDMFSRTIEKVRNISDKNLFDELKEQKDKNYIYWDYFGQFVDTGRIPVSELDNRLKAIEKWRVTDNIKNPEQGETIAMYRDLKPPLADISINSAGIGAAMVESDLDGRLRKMPLFIKFKDDRIDKTKKNKPLMEKPEYYMGIDLVLAMSYYKVNKEDLEIIIGDKVILKNATLPINVKIIHEYIDENFTAQSREYYFNYDDIKKYFKNASNFPEFTTIRIIHYENQKLIEDGKTTLANILPLIKEPSVDLKEIRYNEQGSIKTIGNFSEAGKEKYIIVEYGKISFKINKIKEIISSLFGEEDMKSVNVVFSHWMKNNDNTKTLIEDGRATLTEILENADPVYGFMGLGFNDKEKGWIEIEDYDNTEIAIVKGNGAKIKMSANELIEFLSSSVDLKKMEKETPTVYTIPLYELLKQNLNNNIIVKNDEEEIKLNFIEDIDVTISESNLESFKFKAMNFNKVFFPEPIIKDVVIPIDKKGKFVINFQGEANKTFETQPIYHLYPELTSRKGDPGRSNWATYKNRVLLAGIYSSAGINTEGRKDTFETPYGTMFGIEVHANALYTLFNQDFIEKIPWWGDFLIQIAIVLIFILILPRISILKGLMIGLFALLLVFVEGIFFFAMLKIDIPIIPQFMAALFGFIALTFVKLLSEEREKRQIRGVFSTYVNAEVVNELLKDPEHALQLGGATKTITCFFSDIRGFTTLSEELKKVSDTELVTRMNEYFTIMTDIVLKYKGTLDKYMGDAIMAFWGAPIEYDKHALLACKTAIEMIEQLPVLKARWPENLRNFDIGIGINTGPAVAGNTGSELRKDYTILGDTVNLGSRLEGVNKTYHTRVIISEFTYEEVKDYVIARELDLIRVKGKTEPVRIYELLGLNESGENYRIGDIKIKFEKKLLPSK